MLVTWACNGKTRGYYDFKEERKEVKEIRKKGEEMYKLFRLELKLLFFIFFFIKIKKIGKGCFPRFSFLRREPTKAESNNCFQYKL